MIYLKDQHFVVITGKIRSLLTTKKKDILICFITAGRKQEFILTKVISI